MNLSSIVARMKHIKKAPHVLSIVIILFISSIVFYFYNTTHVVTLVDKIKQETKELLTLSNAYASANAADKAAMLDNLKLKAFGRRDDVLKLMRSDPTHASQVFLTADEVSKLPDAIKNSVERKVTVNGELYVFSPQVDMYNKSSTKVVSKYTTVEPMYSIKINTTSTVALLFADRKPNFSSLKNTSAVEMSGMQISDTLFVSAKDNPSRPYFAEVKNAVKAVTTTTALPDIDVLYIERTPKYDFDAVKNKPAVGDTVTFIAHVKNNGTAATGAFNYEWQLDGLVISSGNAPSIAPNQEKTFPITWTWNDSVHILKFIADKSQTIAEVSDSNNQIEIKTNALMIGFWVERSLYNWFNQHQKDLGIGSNSWEDWAQRQIATMNDLFVQSAQPDTYLNIKDSVRLEKVTIVADGALPLYGALATNNPDERDKSIDLVWGFPNGSQNNGFYGTNGQPRLDASEENHFLREYALLHELGHARYLWDWYLWNFNTQQGQDQVAVRNSYYQQIAPPATPKVYECDGGMMQCSSPYAKRYLYSTADIYALNAKAYQRALCGNSNAPCDIASFLFKIPAKNSLKFIDSNNQPLTNATIDFFRSEQDSTTGNPFIDDQKDLSCVTNNLGVCVLTENVFGISANPNKDEIGDKGALVLRVTKGNQEGYQWLYDSTFAVEYMKGNASEANYTIPVVMTTKSSRVVTPTPTLSPTPNSNPQTPFKGIISIPGVVEAEDFDNGGEGVSYHDLATPNQYNNYRPNERPAILLTPDSDVYNPKYFVTDTRKTEWLEYTINVAQSATYTISARLITYAPNTSFHLELRNKNTDAVVVTSPSFTIAQSTEGQVKLFQNIGTIQLPAGVNVLRIVFDSEVRASGYTSSTQIDFLEFTASGVQSPTPTLTPTPTLAYNPPPPANTPTPTITPTPTQPVNTVDTTPPTLTITSPKNNAVIGKYTIAQLAATASDSSGVKLITITVDGKPQPLKSCPNNPINCIVYYGFTPGTHTVTFTATDYATPVANTTVKSVTITKSQ